MKTEHENWAAQKRKLNVNAGFNDEGKKKNEPAHRFVSVDLEMKLRMIQKYEDGQRHVN